MASQRSGGAGVQRGHRIAVDADSNAYVAGVSFDKGVLAPKIKATAPFGNGDLFLLKVDGAGDNLWGIRRGDEYAQAAFDVAVDSMGKIASCGITNGTLGLGGTAPAITSDTFDVFVARFDP